MVRSGLVGFLSDGVYTCIDEPYQVLRRKAQLHATDACTYKDSIVKKGAFVNESRELLLHPDGGAAPADVARERQQLLDVQHFTVLVAGSPGGHFEVDLQRAGDNADERA